MRTTSKLVQYLFFPSVLVAFNVICARTKKNAGDIKRWHCRFLVSKWHHNPSNKSHTQNNIVPSRYTAVEAQKHTQTYTPCTQIKAYISEVFDGEWVGQKRWKKHTRGNDERKWCAWWVLNGWPVGQTLSDCLLKGWKTHRDNCREKKKERQT